MNSIPKTLGTPYREITYGVCVCPQCGSKVDMDDVGVGMAYGGGYGTYYTCRNPNCDWFYKEIENE